MDDFDPEEGAADVNEIMAEDDAHDSYLRVTSIMGNRHEARRLVIVPFPFQDRPGQKICPAVVVQSDAENRRLANTVLAMLTGNLADAGRPTTVLVDPRTPEGAGSD